MIIATAGHVDHGKTTLLKALTGVDADRLPEERQRGLTIDLGFAYSDRILPGSIVGFVDVPGHERFIHNMLAGVTAIRAAMLVVAADDGPMPQTQEHLDILDLVGVERGLVALTKTDRVDAARIAEVEEDIAILLEGTALSGARVFPVSATTGSGVRALADHLSELAATSNHNSGQGHFRLPVDRVFTVEGAGLVVTGLVRAGAVKVGDTVRVLPDGRDLRVRGLRAQDQVVQEAVEGDRCAVNLAGAARKEDIRRGDWIVSGPAQAASRRFDASIRLLRSEDRALKHWTPVHAHVGTADVTGRVALLEGTGIEPGGTGLVQLVLDTTVHASAGDAVVLRDQSARRTLGGGRILDPMSPARGRARPERLDWVRALALGDRKAALDAVLGDSPGGAPLHVLSTIWNMTPAEADELFTGVGRVCRDDTETVGLTAAHWAQLQKSVLAALEDLHRQKPDAAGVHISALSKSLPLRARPAALQDAIGALVRSGQVKRAGAALQRAGFESRLPAADEKLWQRAVAVMSASGDKPPTIWEISEALSVDQKAMERLLARVARLGRVQRVSDNRYMTPDMLRHLADIAERGAKTKENGRFTAADYRDWSGMGRNLSIEILEFFDKVSLTRRNGNERIVTRSAVEVFGERADETATAEAGAPAA